MTERAQAAELTPDDLAALGAKLRAARADVAAAIEARLHGHGLDRHAEAGLPRRAEDTDDDAAAEAQRSMDIVQLSHTTAELAEIDSALARVADGSYGWCSDCGGPVGRARLMVQPMAVRCAPCQGKHEKRVPVR
jgi:RNA polymerase-binding transcription factor DksA